MNSLSISLEGGHILIEGRLRKKDSKGFHLVCGADCVLVVWNILSVDLSQALFSYVYSIGTYVA